MLSGEIAQIISSAVQAFATVVLVIVTIYYAFQTKKTVDAMERSSRNDFLPIIIAAHYTLVSDEKNMRIELRNEGKGLAKRPFKIIFPGVAPIFVNSMSPKEKQSIEITYNEEYVLSLEAKERRMIIEYQDIFGRTVKTEAPLVECANLGPNKNTRGLTWETWYCILP